MKYLSRITFLAIGVLLIFSSTLLAQTTTVSGMRTLPGSYTAGGTVDVSIGHCYVDEAPMHRDGLIVDEFVPAGWTLVGEC